MSSIIELRKQIRQVTADFQEQIASLTEQLAEIQPLEISRKEQKMNFRRLERANAKCAFQEHPLKNEDEDTRYRYLMLLCTVAQTSVYVNDAWVFIQRIASGVGVGALERCAADAMRLSVDDVELAANALTKHGLGEMFLLDAMLVYLACGEKKTEQAKELILELAAMLKQQPKDIEWLVNRARDVAAGDVPMYQRSFNIHRRRKRNISEDTAYERDMSRPNSGKSGMGMQSLQRRKNRYLQRTQQQRMRKDTRNR